MGDGFGILREDARWRVGGVRFDIVAPFFGFRHLFPFPDFSRKIVFYVSVVFLHADDLVQSRKPGRGRGVDRCSARGSAAFSI